MSANTAEMTNHEATDEALLLFIRKMRRLHPDAFGDIWAQLPEGAQTALRIAETRADVLRDSAGGPSNLQYPEDPYGLGDDNQE